MRRRDTSALESACDALQHGGVDPRTELRALVQRFYDPVDELGAFSEVASGALPAPYDRLLDHTDHMTVTVEAHHATPVDLRVLETLGDDRVHIRKIVLTRASDQAVVQFGLVRLHLDHLAEPIRREVVAQRTPLGRILIEHDVLRHVELLALWRIDPGAELCEQFGLDRPVPCYGRTARIYCDGEPTIELLEIVAPE